MPRNLKSKPMALKSTEFINPRPCSFTYPDGATIHGMAVAYATVLVAFGVLQNYIVVHAPGHSERYYVPISIVKYADEK